MEMQGEYKIPASRDVVWEALNDPDVLSACIPGCKSLERTGDNGYAATVQAKVGPVKATFKGEVTLSDIDPPNGYRISGEGKGGAAGFAKGGATVTLTEDGDGTLLSYTVDANVGGKLAQIGSRLIDSTSKKLAGEFFDAFVEEVKKRDGSAPAPETGAAEQQDTESMEPPVVDDPVTMPIQNATEASKTSGAASPAANDTADTAGDTTPDSSPSQAAMKAVDDVSKQRKGLQPMVWSIALVVVVIILIAAFASP